MTLDPKFLQPLRDLQLEAAEQGQALYVVGGTLRDLVLGVSFHDLDMACANAPAWAAWFAHRVHSKCIALDETPGRETLRVPLGKEFFCDFSTLQGPVIEEDLARRDFTINALAQPLQKFLEGREGILDPFGGRNDLDQQRIRALPGTPFRDDPVRLLRAFRFSAQLGFSIEPETLKSVSGQTEMILNIAGERISHELLLFLDTPEPGVPEFVASGLAQTLIRGFAENECYSEAEVLGRWEKRSLGKESPSAPLAEMDADIEDYLNQNHHRGLYHLALLLSPLNPIEQAALPPRKFRENSAPVRFMRHYKFSIRQWTFVDRALFFSSWFRDRLRPPSEAPWSEQSLYQGVRHCRNEFIASLLLTLTAPPLPDREPSIWKQSIEALYDFYHKRFLPAADQPTLLNGTDLSRKFRLKPSPLFKIILEQVEEARVLGHIHTREEAEALANNLIQTST